MDNNSSLFLQYIESQGFNCDDYNRILELFQSSRSSLSQYLTGFNQYLLSKSVNYDELDEMGIDGAYGYLDDFGGILVPKCFKNDERFLYDDVKGTYKKHSYGAPTIDEFDIIIGRIPSSFNADTRQQLIASLIHNFERDQYFGLCLNTDNANDSKQLISLYQGLVEQVNSEFAKRIYTFEHDTIQSQGKELCLIKRSK